MSTKPLRTYREIRDILVRDDGVEVATLLQNLTEKGVKKEDKWREGLQELWLATKEFHEAEKATFPESDHPRLNKAKRRFDAAYAWLEENSV